MSPPLRAWLRSGLQAVSRPLRLRAGEGLRGLSLVRLWRPILAMMIVVVASNWLVQFPINAWLTWGAFVYPVAYLVTDLTNRAVGARQARRVAWWVRGRRFP